MSGPGNTPAARAPALSGDQVTVAALLALEFAPPLPQDIPALALAKRPGITATRAAGQGHVIRELRPFADGDDPRFLDAAASARAGSPQVRGFHEDREGNLLLIADFRRPMLWGSRLRFRSVAAAEVLMRLGWQAMAAGGAAGLVTLSDQGLEVTRPRARHSGMSRIASHLARAHQAALAAQQGPHETPDLDSQLAAALRHAPPGAMVALASGLDAPGAGLTAVLAALAQRGPATLLLIEDPMERAAPAGALASHRAGAAPSELLSFGALPASRSRRAANLHLPGLRVARIASDTSAREAAG
ncbi:DUF58 domain-containing protein [Falsigemmobacter faecalis]|uniref:DUF58 domain-containing protein n=1 Tax=Falsigemmobacter faecalis TaxID=2488730 RepID=A0A3P3DEQ8_9RHOB|nr:DUF58 domain-containing protein [Falsigemmobacter faecalis]RRH72324.1 DUF58 domain-containing protein [Falsigemmobacter faecalis]